MQPKNAASGSAFTPVSGRKTGSCEYVVELENDAGISKSDVIVVNVRK